MSTDYGTVTQPPNSGTGATGWWCEVHQAEHGSHEPYGAPCAPQFYNEQIGARTGYVAGQCGHAVALSEWWAGFRVCERCPRAGGSDGTGQQQDDLDTINRIIRAADSALVREYLDRLSAQARATLADPIAQALDRVHGELDGLIAAVHDAAVLDNEARTRYTNRLALPVGAIRDAYREDDDTIWQIADWSAGKMTWHDIAAIAECDDQAHTDCVVLASDAYADGDAHWPATQTVTVRIPAGE